MVIFWVLLTSITVMLKGLKQIFKVVALVRTPSKLEVLKNLNISN